MKGWLSDELVPNLKAGLTVSLVSVPLSISLAIANGATPIMGMRSAWWGGLWSALLGGSQYNIHGPTGALSGIVSKAASTYGIEMVPFIAILSGLISFLFFFLRIDKYVLYMPSAVMHGFTIGVAFIIGLGQLNFAFGLPAPLVKHEEFYKNVLENLKLLGSANMAAVIVFVVLFVSLMLLLKLVPKIPWMMVIAVIGVCGGYYCFSQKSKNREYFGLLSLQDKYGKLEPELFTPAHIPWKEVDSGLITTAFSVAFISVLETLISAKIADTMTNTMFIQTQEVVALATANIFSGIFGGVPTTAALARTALNIRSGATSRLAGIINATGVLVISLALLFVFQYLLLPAIAAILVAVAVRMVEFEPVVHMFHNDRGSLILCLFVVAITIFVGPTEGIIIGAIIPMFTYADRIATSNGEAVITKGNSSQASSLSLLNLDEDPEECEVDVSGDTLVYTIAGQLTYVNASSHFDRIKRIAHKYKVIIFSMRHLYYVDLDGVDLLGQMIAFAEKSSVVLLAGCNHSGVKEDVDCDLGKRKWYSDKSRDGLIFSDYEEALEACDGQVIESLIDDKKKRKQLEEQKKAPKSLTPSAGDIELAVVHDK